MAANEEFDVEKVLNAIERCRNQFGEESLFRGNCGMFSVALSKWIFATMGVPADLVGVALVFKDDPNPLSLAQIRGRDLNHVFSLVEVAGESYLFDGTGLVSEAALNDWHKQTWYDCGPGYDADKWQGENGELPIGVGLAFGSIDSEDIATVEQDTQSSTTWQEFYECLCSVDLTLKPKGTSSLSM
jgi:hypothetical protein